MKIKRHQFDQTIKLSTVTMMTRLMIMMIVHDDLEVINDDDDHGNDDNT